MEVQFLTNDFITSVIIVHMSVFLQHSVIHYWQYIVFIDHNRMDGCVDSYFERCTLEHVSSFSFRQQNENRNSQNRSLASVVFRWEQLLEHGGRLNAPSVCVCVPVRAPRWSCSGPCRTARKLRKSPRTTEEERRLPVGTSISVCSTSWAASSRTEGLLEKGEAPGRREATSTRPWTSEWQETFRSTAARVFSPFLSHSGLRPIKDFLVCFSKWRKISML